MTTEEIYNRIASLTNQLVALDAERSSLLNQWAALACPHKAGDVVPCASWAHHGKQAHIDRVSWVDAHDPRWHVVGRIVKKDGTPGLVEVDTVIVQDSEGYSCYVSLPPSWRAWFRATSLRDIEEFAARSPANPATT